MLRTRRLLVFTGALLWAAATASAQERFGELYGSVLDPTQAVLPNVTVTVTNKETGRTLTKSTGADGTWVASNLEPGHYKLRWEVKGFQIAEVPDVTLLLGKRLKVDNTLQVGTASETVQVTEQPPLIDFSGTTISHNITAEEFDRLPKPRSFQQMALLSPSVNAGEVEGGFQINGASGAENQFIIDGISTNSLIDGRSRQNALFELLQEVQVKTAGIDAEYGGALGGVVSAVTKSGGNQFHGEFHYYLSGSKLNASPARRLLLDPSTELTARHVQDSKQKDNRHEIGGSLGGYIVKNKLWFLTAFSPQYRNRTNEYLYSGGVRGTLDNEITSHTMFQKLSWNPVQKVRANFTYLWTPVASNGRLPAYSAGPNEVTLTREGAEPNRAIGYFSPQTNYTGQVDYTPTATSLVTIRAGRFWDNYKTNGITSASAIEYGNSGIGLPFEIPAALRQGLNYSTTPRQLNTFHDLATRTYAQLDFSKFSTFLGQHNFKAGFGRTKTVNNVDETYPGGGYIRIFWNTSFNSPALGAQRGQYGYYEVNDSGTRGSTGASMNNFYIQDSWRVLPRLTLNLGVRFENEVVPSFRREIKDFAFNFGYGDKIAPRIGGTFDLFGDGRVKIYGSYGLFYDWVKYELSRGTFGGDVWRTRYRSLDTLDILSLSGTNMPGRNIWNPNSDVRDRRVPSFDLIDPAIKPMSSQIYNGGVEMTLAANTVFRASFIRNDLRRTIEDLGALDAQGNEVYLYANPGEGRALLNPTTGTTKPFPMPRAERTYDAMELVVTKRMSKGYFASASYVLSRLYGNYSGLANSDELTSPSTGLTSAVTQQSGGNIARAGGSANRNWDLDEALFDSKGNIVYGRLATDRPHVFKLYGSKTLSWKGGHATDLGMFFYAGSGTPVTTYVNTVNHIPMMVNGRGDLGRTPFLTQTDLVVSHEVGLGEHRKLRFEMNCQNLFNQKTPRSRFRDLDRGVRGLRDSSVINLRNVDLQKGFDYRALLALTPDAKTALTAYDPRYGLDDIFNPGFTGRFGVKFIF